MKKRCAERPMKEKSTVYVETTVPSFLTAYPANNLIVAGKQEVTRQWWEKRRAKYRIYISQYVLDETSSGDTQAAERRMVALRDIDLLEVDEEVLRLARVIIDAGLVPEKSATDAGHIAVAARHGMDFLITWNCTHIANAHTRPKIEATCRVLGYESPVICTPNELMES